jgi:hypothetical protein
VPEPLAELFSSRVRAAVLALLLPRPHLGFSLTELSRRLGLPVSSLQHECYKLSRLGVLRGERQGNTRRYRPDPAWPLLEPLTALTVRSLPMNETLCAAIEEVPGIEAAWLAGELASRAEPVYVVIVGNLGVEELDGVFARARVVLIPEVGLDRVELAYFRPIDWSNRSARDDRFAGFLFAHREIELYPFSEPGEPGAVDGV